MSNMTIQVSFLAGTALEYAIAEAKEKAIEWGVAYVTFDFNGVHFNVGQNSGVTHLVEQFYKVLDSKSGYKFVV